MMRLPLQFLPAFRVAAELQNLRAAAVSLHLTPSAISQQIHALETQLGFALFDRQGRRVVLNAAGAVLLRSVQAALAELDAGVQGAASVAPGAEQQLVRLTVVPALAQRWLLPRIARWRARHPGVRIEIDASARSADLAREGHHAAIRAGAGNWPGLIAEPLFDFDGPLCVVGCGAAARRLAAAGGAPEGITAEPLLGDARLWRRWADAAGLEEAPAPVATFGDSGLLLQAAEQDLGLALARGLYIVDALADGRLVRLSEVAVPYAPAQRYYFVYPPALRDWAPLAQVRAWLRDELALSLAALAA
jgi:LysR family glycine cleavage system transcriptional activator